MQEEREKIIDTVVEQWGFLAIFMVALAAFEWYRWWFNVQPKPGIFTAAAGLMTVLAVWRIWKVLPSLRNLRQARDGERVVGEFLNRMREHGYQVFHDVVGDKFNVDHVLIGPSGVYTVETKTWSKPARGRAEIIFDGERVKVGSNDPDRDPVQQARAQAGWVARLLAESAGKQPFVRPVVAFPGWFVTKTALGATDLWVLEPKALPAFIANEPARMAQEDVKLFSFHLSRYIRVREAEQG